MVPVPQVQTYHFFLLDWTLSFLRYCASPGLAQSSQHKGASLLPGSQALRRLFYRGTSLVWRLYQPKTHHLIMRLQLTPESLAPPRSPLTFKQ